MYPGSLTQIVNYYIMYVVHSKTQSQSFYFRSINIKVCLQGNKTFFKPTLTLNLCEGWPVNFHNSITLETVMNHDNEVVCTIGTR